MDGRENVVSEAVLEFELEAENAPGRTVLSCCWYAARLLGPPDIAVS